MLAFVPVIVVWSHDSNEIDWSDKVSAASAMYTSALLSFRLDAETRIEEFEELIMAVDTLLEFEYLITIKS